MSALRPSSRRCPGRPSRRRSRSGPSAASVQIRLGVVAVVASRSRRRAAGPCRPSSPGSGAAPAARGRPRRARSGSVAAIRAASRWPSRRWSSAGPLKAFWTVTCWSSAKPMSRASGFGDEQPVGLVVAGERQSVGGRRHERHGSRPATAPHDAPIAIVLVGRASARRRGRNLAGGSAAAGRRGRPDRGGPRTRRRAADRRPPGRSGTRLGRPRAHRLPQPPRRRHGVRGRPGDHHLGRRGGDDRGAQRPRHAGRRLHRRPGCRHVPGLRRRRSARRDRGRLDARTADAVRRRLRDRAGRRAAT